ncbi:transcription factor DIVARICATA-like [Cornus florida]|uniref:transcription factor DIVARICATA-like n=1 Tax=Cornus florida TaxID=4283 RepID=UPI0028981D57|nr:transcription factor DIVARICATA-like [Cornus florida]
MEGLYPSSSYILSSNWLLQESRSTIWTREENKRFEKALAIFDEHSPDRWLKVAEMIPGKSVLDVMKQYEDLAADVDNIEAGLIPIPGYLTSSFTLEFVDNCDFDMFRKRSSTGGSSDQERRKGVPWTEEEHRRFLMGLQKHGKGDWRNISRNFVVSKTPTQVASHAQKYFIRQNSEGKEKRRPSIHDITVVHLTGTTSPDNQESPSSNKFALIPPPLVSQRKPKIFPNWNHSNDGSVMVFDSTQGNMFMQYRHEVASHGLNLQGGAYHGARTGPHNSVFQIQSTRYQILE